MASKGMSVFSHQGEDYTINDANITNEFDATVSNEKGDYVNYQGDLYRFDEAYPANTAWSSRSKTKVKLGQIVAGMERGLNADWFNSLNLLGYANMVLSDADDAEPNSVYQVVTSSESYYPDHMPATYSGYLITIRGKAKGFEQYFWTQFATDTELQVLYYRTRIGTSGPASGSYGSWKQSNQIYKANDVLGYAALTLDDANNAKDNSIYRVFSSELNNYPKNLPYKDPTEGWLITVKNKASGYETYYFYQTFFDSKLNAKYYRTKLLNNGSGTWNAWKRIDSADNYITTKGENLLYVDKETAGHYVDYNTGATGTVESMGYTVIPVTEGQIYKLVSSVNCHIAFFNSTSLTTQTYISGVLAKGLITVPLNAIRMTVSFQYAKINEYWLNLESAYTEPRISEELIKTINNVVYVKKDGSGDFTKLTDALAFGMEHKNTTIYLEPGTYDIIDELGDSYFEDFVYEAFTNMGPRIGNGTHLICSQKSKIVCNYTGSNQEVEMGFSPFNPSAANSPDGIGDFIIEGANIEASRVRYIVHDDIGIQTIPYRHEYIRCKMYLDNTNNTHHTTHHSLGGGMGIDGVIVVKDCIFDGDGTEDVDVAWHNDNYTQPQMGYIDISGCYFRGTGTVQITSIGTYTDKTPCLIHDNSFGSEIVKYVHEGSADNMEILAWGNEVRTE